MTPSGLDITLKEEDIFSDDTKASTYIKSKEGFRETPYWDNNHWTWGYGTTAPHSGGPDEPPPSDLTITRTEAQGELLAYMQKEVFDRLKPFDEEHGYNFTDSEVAALTSFMFNLGPGSLNQVTANGTRSKEEIANKMLEYINSAGQPSQGLINRRQEEHDLFTGKIIL